MADDDQQKSMLNEKRNILIHALGGAVSRWADVERNLVSIFATAARLPLPLAANVL